MSEVIKKKKSLGYTAEEVDSALEKSILSYTNEQIDEKIANIFFVRHSTRSCHHIITQANNAVRLGFCL